MLKNMFLKKKSSVFFSNRKIKMFINIIFVAELIIFFIKNSIEIKLNNCLFFKK